jgi:hypothetical protein
VEHQREIVLTIVEGVTVAGGEVKEIRMRPEARLFFEDYVAEGDDIVGEQEELEPAVGWWHPRTGPGLLPTNRAEVFAAYA